MDRASGKISPSPEDVELAYLAELGLWRLPSREAPDLDKLIAYVVQEHGVTPEAVGRMTHVELVVYAMSLEESKLDNGTIICIYESRERLTLEQRVELARRKMAARH